MPYAIMKTPDTEEKETFCEQPNDSTAQEIPKDNMMDYLNAKVYSNNTYLG